MFLSGGLAEDLDLTGGRRGAMLVGFEELIERAETTGMEMNGGNEAALAFGRELVLASGSPRRRQLLAEAGYEFRVQVPTVEEPDPAPWMDPESYAVHLAWLKARDVAQRCDKPALVLAGDTVVAIGREVLGKPVDREDAKRILRRLSGQEHVVYSSVCVWLVPENCWLGGCERSTLYMRPWTDEALEAYLDRGDWEGKAGAYGIQDPDPNVELLEGSYTNVVGMPMELTERLLSLLGCKPGTNRPGGLANIREDARGVNP